MTTRLLKADNGAVKTSRSASPLLTRFQAGSASTPKYLRLCQSIIDAVKAGDLPVGSMLAGERELSQELGLSLGTTQKALGRLVSEGFLVRRQGHGTFVGGLGKPMSDAWHFRFVPPEGGPQLPVFAKIIERSIEARDGPWTSALGPDAKGYVMIRRSLDIGGKFLCASRIYLPATRFARLLRIAEKRLGNANLKALLADEFAAPTLYSEGLARAGLLSREDTTLIGVPQRTHGLLMQVTGLTFGYQPITFQVINVPPTLYGLKLDFNPPGSHLSQ